MFDSVAVSRSNPNIVYAAKEEAVFRSEDLGETWERLGFNAPGYRMGIPIGLEVDPINPAIVYLNSYEGGVYRSEDGGQSWQSANKGYTGAQVSDIALDPQDPHRFYVAALLGVFKSLDEGASYLGMNRNDNTFEFARSITAGPHDWQTAFTGNQWSGQVSKSNNGGRTWVELGALSPQVAALRRLDIQLGITSIVISPDDPKTIYVTTVTGRENDPSEVEQHEGLGIFKSTDGGQSWQSINDGLPSNQVFTLIMDSHNPQVLYAGTFKGLARTTDSGEHWEALRTGLSGQGVRALTIDPQNPAIIYVGLEGAGVFKTMDRGDHWQWASLGMDPQANIRAIAVHPVNSAWVFAADWHTGVYYSENGGQTWTRINQGLRTRAVNKLAIAQDGSVLYAGTEGEGVFRLDLAAGGR